MDVLWIVLGLIFLVFGGDFLVKASVGLSLKLSIPKVVIGMTVVSFATSAPELIVSVKSALNGATGLALGNVIGSNIANLGLVLAVTIILSTIEVEKSFYKTDWPVMMIASLLLYFFVVKDKTIQQYEGAIFVVLLVLFLVYVLKFQKQVVDESSEDDVPLPLSKIILFMLLGGLGLWGGSELLILGAVNLAKALNVSDAVIGVTVVSVGTSIPELAASIIAVIKKEKAISLGNLIGSNIFNVFAVLGITSIITPVRIKADATSLITNDIFWMLGFAFAILPLVFIPKSFRLSWKSGVILLVGYVTFICLTIS